MQKKVIAIIMMIIMLPIINAKELEKVKVELRLYSYYRPKQISTDKIIKGKYEDYLLLETELSNKIYKTTREIKLYERKASGKGFYLHQVQMGHVFDSKDYVVKEEYEKNPNLILSKNGKFNKDIYLKTLPKGTLFKLKKIILDAGYLSELHYYIEIQSEAEYKDKEIEAVCISVMNIDWRDSVMWAKNWDGWFIDRDKRKIYSEKIPLIDPYYAKELSKKEYEEYYKKEK